MNHKKILANISALTIFALVMPLFSVFAQTWTPPTTNPPGGNVPAPINVGGTAQTRTGDLTLGQILNVLGSVVIGGTPTGYKLDVTNDILTGQNSGPFLSAFDGIITKTARVVSLSHTNTQTPQPVCATSTGQLVLCSGTGITLNATANPSTITVPIPQTVQSPTITVTGSGVNLSACTILRQGYSASSPMSANGTFQPSRTSIIAGANTYNISCPVSSGTGTATTSVTITGVNSASIPTIALTAPSTSVVGQPFTIGWATTNIRNTSPQCSASIVSSPSGGGDWDGPKDNANGITKTEQITPTSSATFQYKLECTGTNQTIVSDTVSVYVAPAGSVLASFNPPVNGIIVSPPLDEKTVVLSSSAPIYWTTNNIAGSTCRVQKKQPGTNPWQPLSTSPIPGAQQSLSNPVQYTPVATNLGVGTHTYRVVCSHSGNSSVRYASNEVDLIVVSNTTPTLDLKANGFDSLTLSSGAPAILTWTSTNIVANSCTANFTTPTPNLNVPSSNSSQTTYIRNPIASGPYIISCQGTNGSTISDTVNVNVTNATTSVSATITPNSIYSGQTASVAWTGNGVNSNCRIQKLGGGTWTNLFSSAVQSSPVTVTPAALTNNTPVAHTYRVACSTTLTNTPPPSNNSYTVFSNPVTVTVNPATAPIITMKIGTGQNPTGTTSPLLLPNYASSHYVAWTTTNATLCTRTSTPQNGDWNAAANNVVNNSTGISLAGPFSASLRTYTITCTNASGGTATASIQASIYNPTYTTVLTAPAGAWFAGATLGGYHYINGQEQYKLSAVTTSSNGATPTTINNNLVCSGTSTFVPTPPTNGQTGLNQNNYLSGSLTSNSVLANFALQSRYLAGGYYGVTHTIECRDTATGPILSSSSITLKKALTLGFRVQGISPENPGCIDINNPTTGARPSTTTLEWRPDGASSCVASGGWSGTKTSSTPSTVNGVPGYYNQQVSLPASGAAVTFNLACSNPNNTPNNTTNGPFYRKGSLTICAQGNTTSTLLAPLVDSQNSSGITSSTANIGAVIDLRDYPNAYNAVYYCKVGTSGCSGGTNRTMPAINSTNINDKELSNSINNVYVAQLNALAASSEYNYKVCSSYGASTSSCAPSIESFTTTQTPSVTLSANGISMSTLQRSGGTNTNYSPVTLSWNASNTTSCTPQGWTASSNNNTTGSGTVDPTTMSATYGINCIGLGGQTYSDTITINSGPIVNFSTNKPGILVQSTSNNPTITWSTPFATSCTKTKTGGTNSGWGAASSSLTPTNSPVSQLMQTTLVGSPAGTNHTFTINCLNSFGAIDWDLSHIVYNVSQSVSDNPQTVACTGSNNTYTVYGGIHTVTVDGPSNLSSINGTITPEVNRVQTNGAQPTNTSSGWSGSGFNLTNNSGTGTYTYTYDTRNNNNGNGDFYYRTKLTIGGATYISPISVGKVGGEWTSNPNNCAI